MVESKQTMANNDREVIYIEILAEKNEYNVG